MQNATVRCCVFIDDVVLLNVMFSVNVFVFSVNVSLIVIEVHVANNTEGILVVTLFFLL